VVVWRSHQAETINYRTFKPERDGLFCAKIFGPITDWECLCGKYKRMKHRGVICDKCGVEVTQAKVRRERLGHIKLATPVSHVWFFKGCRAASATCSDISLRDLERVLYFEAYVVVDPGETELKQNQLLNEEQYRKAREEHQHEVQGADGRRGDQGAAEARQHRAARRGAARKMRDRDVGAEEAEVRKRLKVVDSFRKSSNQPSG
jgi:DNA-directed RNA polymerase subunit beta'